VSVLVQTAVAVEAMRHGPFTTGRWTVSAGELPVFADQ